MSKPINHGQQFISGVEAALEHNGNRPLGMPPLDAIQSELMRLGYPKSDAEQVYDGWLANGFRTKIGKIRDWKAALRTIIRYKGLLSQRAEPPGLIQHRQEKPAQLAEAARDRRKTGYGLHKATEEECKRLGSALRQWRKNQ